MSVIARSIRATFGAVTSTKRVRWVVGSVVERCDQRCASLAVAHGVGSDTPPLQVAVDLFDLLLDGSDEQEWCLVQDLKRQTSSWHEPSERFGWSIVAMSDARSSGSWVPA